MPETPQFPLQNRSQTVLEDHLSDAQPYHHADVLRLVKPSSSDGNVRDFDTGSQADEGRGERDTGSETTEGNVQGFERVGMAVPAQYQE